MELLYVTEGLPHRDPVHGDGSSMIAFEVIRHLPPDIRLTLATFRGARDVPVEVRDRCDHLLLMNTRTTVAAMARSVLTPLPARARLLTVSKADAVTWSAMVGKPVQAIGNRSDPVRRSWEPPDVPTVTFVGSLSYLPNVESATTLATEVAPLLWRVLPDLRVIIAGRQPTPAVLALASSRVEVRPDVPSVEDVFAQSSVAVFPDGHGVGVRNSVREALMCGVPVVATVAAAREQGPHPLLKVAADDREIVALVLSALAHGACPTPEQDDPADRLRGRTWQEVASDYVDECAEAMRLGIETDTVR